MVGTGSTLIFLYPARLLIQARAGALVSMSQGRVGVGSGSRLGSGLHPPRVCACTLGSASLGVCTAH